MPIEVRSSIVRADLKGEPEALFVFGDDLQRTGMAGQAGEMRGEPNAVGVPTRHARQGGAHAFFEDADFEAVKPAIDQAFTRLNAHVAAGGKVVWPEGGIGTGLAQLAERAPRIAAYLEDARAGLFAAAARPGLE